MTLSKAIIAGILVLGFALAATFPGIEISIQETSAYAGGPEEGE